MKVLINFADDKYKKTQKFNSWTGRKIARFDKIICYSPEDIDNVFKQENNKVFTYKRGYGLWLWKPYLIKKTMDSLKDGDYLFYSDSGAFFIKSIDCLINSMGDDDIWLYGLPLIEKQFTKQDAFELMDCIGTEYSDTNQFSGTFVLLKVGNTSRKFVKEWLEYCKNEKIISPNESDTDSILISHREDQSILSLLAKKNKLTIHKDPTQYGKIPEKYRGINRIFIPLSTEDKYGVILIHHRTSNVNFVVCIKQFLCGVLPRCIGLTLIK